MKEFEQQLRERYEKPERTVLTIRDLGLPRQCLLLVREIYQHPQTNQHTKDLIRFKLKQFLGDDYDIKGFLDEK